MYHSPFSSAMSITSPGESDRRRAIRADMSICPDGWKAMSCLREFLMKLFMSANIRWWMIVLALCFGLWCLDSDFRPHTAL